ncbi:hypothetical protein AB0G04_06460 [Actinoplanes sp. NPDC023801]|uniref:hypothetical protein n=1 Tax=Actinoplanes sp. NPDC023801 TaxID=3154595 RepID=UPI00340CBBDD
MADPEEPEKAEEAEQPEPAERPRKAERPEKAEKSGEPAAGKATEEKAPDDHAAEPARKDARKIAEVVNIFQKGVNAGLIGQGGAGAGFKGTPRSLTGKIDEAEVSAETEYYCRPESFDEALDRLVSDHVVSICGGIGSGKRTGGINLLRAVTTGQLVVMSAVSDLKELAGQTYAKGFGYLIVDRVDGSTKGDVDFAWRTVRDRVRRHGAYLVVTTVAADTGVESVAHITWARPDPRRLSLSCLAGRELSGEQVDLIAERLTAECSMADIVATLRAIRDGESPEAALDRLSATSARRVQEWIGQHRSDLQAILDVTALAFLGAVSYREFETLRMDLDACMSRHGVLKPSAPRKKGRADDPDDRILDRRSRLTADDGLICELRTAGRTSDRRVLWFRNGSYRRHVLAELSRRCETPFWHAVAEWLTAMVSRQADPQAAMGLAELAGADFDEVEEPYLTPWSRGEIGATGQYTAVFTVWAMCFRDDTQPTALKIVKQWANHGNPAQRWAAAMAYSGVLGTCDPEQAIRQLWQLIINSAQGLDQASYAMAMLFGTLLDTGNAGRVLTTLDEQLRRPPTRPIDREFTQRARYVLAQVLVIRENQPHVPATFLYLREHPARLRLVARLWAEGLCYRPYRQRVLQALWQGLNRLRHVTDEPLDLARRLGEALVAALPENEVDPFYEEFRVVDLRTREHGKPRRSPALVLLDVVERHRRRKAS